jgi:hypothetical protein
MRRIIASCQDNRQPEEPVLLRNIELPKLVRLIRLLPARPAEFWVRLSTMAEARAESYWRRPCAIEPVDWSRAICDLSQLWRVDVDSCLREAELETVEQEVLRRMRALPNERPFGSFHNGGLRLARLCYALARLIRPLAIVETGVCYGVTSAFLLKALEVNGRGQLHSIDLPPLGENADQFVGSLIPPSLKKNWKLYRGTSKTLLPSVLRSAGGIGLFVHDSLHTYRNMRRELEIVTSHLTGPAVVIADDVEANGAFHEWLLKVGPFYSAVLEEHAKGSLLGLALLHDPNGPVSSSIE